ncbi:MULTISPECIES: polyribonucleotide nucleotidyltransferase [unclassified Candidatus Frackibacter]|uniref:polyribonucleotide nucleotidyltransferase n=1 Tax=unclassified Candidatus Frackibacter TaxID=2648818 RepID=UPI000792904B|nr:MULTISPECIES: polyribonucleotide nucleotidyltransferase [unclassified Candidatus Frackibacter]KXS41596.1 MAG: polyribonucleotide nucleotidyltransferase [Candidatus Frackibacter sp. T328-2]SDB98425.1 polyribonucleotide nucleotidyltransferase [Candidatus Frackibacter sp. WG11]SEM30177.1 polyribonucleotide nucleotidyltransferase [Candidatus Frackibacter sp. WG12]SFL35146.1 polyribonucleotide nucleotidyltransferase [Candidatus Frackibacter sp. WG13]
MKKEWQVEFGGRELTIETGKLAKQANGSVLVKYGETVVLVTATMSDPRPGISYFPLMINYEERLYAAGKIPGGFIKREGRPSEMATLTSRLIDRPLRPLFPKGFRDDVQIVATVLSVDNDNAPDIAAMIGASAALTISDIPFDGPIGGVNIGMIDGEFVVNPTLEQKEESPLDLVVAGNKDGVMMVEAGADEVKEDKMIEAIEFGQEVNQKVIKLQEEMAAEVGKEKAEVELVTTDDPELEAEVREYVGDKIKDAAQTEEKSERNDNVDQVKAEITDYFEEKFAEEEDKDYKMQVVHNTLDKLLKEAIRSLVLDEGVRVDGRAVDEVRPIWCEVGILPRAHGSGVFTRGQTQAMTVATLGAVGDEQILDGLENAESKRYMHHYNFPSFSVGETGPIRGPGRREIGHGALGERALRPMIPSHEEFPYTIRMVSEVLESNGSTSQASICGSTLALMDAGVPIKKPVAGIAMGLMKEGEKVQILSDIQGIEDFNGDMDFKVAGTEDGITALQMDIKIKGVPKDILVKALEQARKGRLHILNEMLKVISESREDLSPYAPSIITIEIDPEKIRDVIGPGGKTIKKIVDENDVNIDIEDDGTVFISAENQEGGQNAKRIIEKITEDVEVGKLYLGEVKKVTNFGAFVEVLPGKEGLVHISELADYHVKKVEDILELGDEVLVKVIGIDDRDRINLSRIEAIKQQEQEEDR